MSLIRMLSSASEFLSCTMSFECCGRASSTLRSQCEVEHFRR